MCKNWAHTHNTLHPSPQDLPSSPPRHKCHCRCCCRHHQYGDPWQQYVCHPPSTRQILDTTLFMSTEVTTHSEKHTSNATSNLRNHATTNHRHRQSQHTQKPSQAVPTRQAVKVGNMLATCRTTQQMSSLLNRHAKCHDTLSPMLWNDSVGLTKLTSFT